LFVEKIPRGGLPLADTLKIIKDLGGIAVAPHPFSQLPGSLSMDAVVSILTMPDLKDVLRGIEIYNMTVTPFSDRVKRVAAYLPFSQTAGSDAHVHWAIGLGKTEFRGTTAAELRTALEQGITIPHPYEKEIMWPYLFNWARRIIMRRLGFVSHASALDERVSTRRMDLRFTKQQRKNLYSE
ncbi:MAG: PHP-associated domain-containing protein, partial [Anaerolineales bacterium]|nr:PHP-associated domain-containing protein [Anaerolineales bacterium]